MFRHDINVLRAIAVVAVVLFHFRLYGLEGGFIGVDVFFVISGYLMSKVILSRLATGRFSYWAFVGMRIARIWPAFIVLVGVLLVLGACLLAPLDYLHLGEQARAALLFVSNVHYLNASTYFTTEVDERWLLQTWSLSVEWQFYMVFPLVLMAVDRVGRGLAKSGAPPHTSLFPFSLAVLFAASLATSIVVTRSRADAAFFLLQSRAWEMLAGGFVYLAEPHFRIRAAFARRALQAASLAAIALAIWLAGRFDWAHRWPGSLALLPVAATAAMLFAGADPAAAAPRWMRVAAVQKIGLWSYSIYLWHWPLVVLMNFMDIENSQKRYAKLAGVTASLLLGAASYRFVELRFKHDHRGAFLQRSVVQPLVATVVATAAAAFVAMSNGWIGRVGDDRAAYVAFQRLAGEPVIPPECDNFQRRKDALVVCRINPTAAGPRVLVYGDSHAQHLYPWFARNASIGVDFLTSSGCAPAPGTNRRDAGFHCDESGEAELERARDPAYAVVIVAGNWADGMERVPAGLCMAHDGRCIGSGASASRAELVRANVVAWTALLALGKTLVVVDQTPTADFEVLPTTMRRRFLGLTPIDSFDDIHANAAGGSAYLDDVLAQLPAGARVRRVSLRSTFCSGIRCRALDAETGEPILLDRSHFVPDWIWRHGAVFRPFVAAP